MDSSNAKILIVDDDQSLRNMLSIVLKKEGYDIIALDNGITALKKIKKISVDLIISDIKMPDINGIDLLKKVKGIRPDIPFILITAYSSTNDAIEAMKEGADDYIIKPFNLDELKIVIKKSLYQKTIEAENIQLRSELEKQSKFENIIGNSQQMLGIFEMVDTISKTDTTVLIKGESGTGKELIANAIHRKSERSGNSFISINCGAIPENLLESELFGHEKGAFTDAVNQKQGLFEVASKGTLFLDEIAEMSQQMQVKLLRAIQERKIRRVGGKEEIEIDVRIISATNKNLLDEIDRNRFRSDLFYRLNVISIEVPPLKERREDIPLLMFHFLKNFNGKFKKNITGFSEDVLEIFQHHQWPGNIRELENYIERAVALEQGSLISVKSLPSEMMSERIASETQQQDLTELIRNGKFNYTQYIDDISKKVLKASLDQYDGNIKKTAEALNLSYRSLRYLLEKYHLK